MRFIFFKPFTITEVSYICGMFGSIAIRFEFKDILYTIEFELEQIKLPIVSFQKRIIVTNYRIDPQMFINYMHLYIDRQCSENSNDYDSTYFIIFETANHLIKLEFTGIIYDSTHVNYFMDEWTNRWQYD